MAAFGDQGFQLAKRCADSINGYVQVGESARHAVVAITTPKEWKRPVPFPKMTLLQVNPCGHRVWHVSAVDLLAWLAANGFVKVEERDSSDA